MQRILIVLGLTLVLVGVLWPLISRMGLGRLPGDIVIDRGNFKFYFPVTTSILISLLIALVMWLLRK